MPKPTPPDRYRLTVAARTVTPSRSFIRAPSSVPVSDDGHSTESDPDKTTVEVEKTVEALAGRGRFPSHGSVIDHREALALGLKVKFLDQKSPLWQRLWLLYTMYDFDCRKGLYSRYLKAARAAWRSQRPACPGTTSAIAAEPMPYRTRRGIESSIATASASVVAACATPNACA